MCRRGSVILVIPTHIHTSTHPEIEIEIERERERERESESERERERERESEPAFSSAVADLRFPACRRPCGVAPPSGGIGWKMIHTLGHRTATHRLNSACRGCRLSDSGVVCGAGSSARRAAYQPGTKLSLRPWGLAHMGRPEGGWWAEEPAR